MKPKFKTPELEAQYDSRSPELLQICSDFIDFSLAIGITPVVTRVTDEVEVESGVHPAGRAVDFRDQYDTEDGPKRLYTDEQVAVIVDALNQKYKRTDGRLTVIHHQVPGSRAHFHLQLAIRKEIYEQPEVFIG